MKTRFRRPSSIDPEISFLVNIKDHVTKKFLCELCNKKITDECHIFLEGVEKVAILILPESYFIPSRKGTHIVFFLSEILTLKDDDPLRIDYFKGPNIAQKDKQDKFLSLCLWEETTWEENEHEEEVEEPAGEGPEIIRRVHMPGTITYDIPAEQVRFAGQITVPVAKEYFYKRIKAVRDEKLYIFADDQSPTPLVVMTFKDSQSFFLPYYFKRVFTVMYESDVLAMDKDNVFYNLFTRSRVFYQRYKSNHPLLETRNKTAIALKELADHFGLPMLLKNEPFTCTIMKDSRICWSMSDYKSLAFTPDCGGVYTVFFTSDLEGIEEDDPLRNVFAHLIRDSLEWMINNLKLEEVNELNEPQENPCRYDYTNLTIADFYEKRPESSMAIAVVIGEVRWRNALATFIRKWADQEFLYGKCRVVRFIAMRENYVPPPIFISDDDWTLIDLKPILTAGWLEVPIRNCLLFNRGNHAEQVLFVHYSASKTNIKDDCYFYEIGSFRVLIWILSKHMTTSYQPGVDQTLCSNQGLRLAFENRHSSVRTHYP